ncbi:MAG TPA: MFS transporter [Candidatus Limnocylindrales bacterium]|nr:MFS transporter [Candidatus Limnocylindrales bacterium]
MSPTGASRVRWLLVFWLFVLSGISYLDRVNISIAGSSLAEEYHLSQVRLGWVFTAFLLGYALFQTPGGWLVDRFGPRRVLTVGVVWWGIFTALTASLPTRVLGAVLFFILVRFLLGAGEAIIYPSSNQFVSQWIPSEERGIANGMIFAGVGAGAGIAPIFVSYLMIHYGWRSSFWVSALLGLVVGIVWYLIARDKPEQHPAVNSSELAFIQQHHGPAATLGSVVENASQRHQTSATPNIPWRSILTSKSILAVTASYFCFGYVAWIFFSWFYIYLAKVRGLDLKASAFYSTLPPLAMVACSLSGGALNDTLSRAYGKRVGRCGVAFLALLLAAAFLVIGSRASSASVASIVLSGGAGALYLSQSSFWSVTADIAGDSAGSASGFMNMGGQFGGALTASLTPAIAQQYGWTSSFLVAAGLSVVGGIAWLLVDPERRLISVTKAES